VRRPSAEASAINSHHCESKGPEILIKKFLFTASQIFYHPPPPPAASVKIKKRRQSTQTKCKRANFTHLALLISFMVLLLQRGGEAHAVSARLVTAAFIPAPCCCLLALSLAKVKIHTPTQKTFALHDVYLFIVSPRCCCMVWEFQLLVLLFSHLDTSN
jgi:hypothetical protein